MLKHIGKHNEKKIVVLYREVPGEAHMCLIVYSDLLPRIYHDAVMQVIESPVGQQAESFADALYRNMMPDGINSLEALHKNGLIKKVATNQVIMTPTPGSTVRLDELNDILNEMKKGEEAIKRLAEMDANRGLTGKKKKPEPKEVGVPPSSRTQPAEVAAAPIDGILSDSDLARSYRSQAEIMKRNAETMLAEVARLQEEAAKLDPMVVENAGKPAKKKTTKIKTA